MDPTIVGPVRQPLWSVPRRTGYWACYMLVVALVLSAMGCANRDSVAPVEPSQQTQPVIATANGDPATSEQTAHSLQPLPPREESYTTATATASIEAAAPSRHMPRTPPLVLAVAQDLLAAERAWFDTLLVEHPEIRLLPYDRPEKDPPGAAYDAAIYWAPQARSDARLLRQEPYALVAHMLEPEGDISLPDLVAIAIGSDPARTLVTGDDGSRERELLGLANLSTLAVPDWQAAKQYVATHQNSYALLPWATVDARVRTLSIDGTRVHPARLQGYPLVRCLWLEGSALPVAVSESLSAALSREVPAAVELVAVGDIMLGRNIKTRMKTISTNYPFASDGIQSLLAGADIAFGNLECAISDRGTRQNKAYAFRADPGAAQALAGAGFDILCLANNHAGDYGDQALVDTLDLLEQAGIRAVGAGRNADQAYGATTLGVGALRVAFLANNLVPPSSFAAGDESPGSAFADTTKLISAVRHARATTDLVIVSCHWGMEYREAPTPTQKRLAQQLAEAGADLVIGHHPHVIQGVGHLERTFIAYSLGNFVFDMNVSATAQEGVALRALFDETGVKTVDLIPYVISLGQPQLAGPDPGSKIMGRMRRLTQGLDQLPS